MLEFGEGLWYIITSGHKESQHFYFVLVFILSQKQMSEIEKKTKKGKAYLRPRTVTAQLASPPGGPAHQGQPRLLPLASRQRRSRARRTPRPRLPPPPASPSHRLDHPRVATHRPVSPSLSRAHSLLSLALSHRARTLPSPPFAIAAATAPASPHRRAHKLRATFLVLSVKPGNSGRPVSSSPPSSSSSAPRARRRRSGYTAPSPSSPSPPLDPQ